MYGRSRHSSMGGTPLVSPRTSPLPVSRFGGGGSNGQVPPQSARAAPHSHYYSSTNNSVAPLTTPRQEQSYVGARSTPPSPLPTHHGPPPASTQWRTKLSGLKNSLIGTPRFHRRKMSCEFFDYKI